MPELIFSFILNMMTIFYFYFFPLILFFYYFVESAAYQALLGNTFIPKAREKVASESESEDEVESALTTVVQKTNVYVNMLLLITMEMLDFNYD